MYVCVCVCVCVCIYVCDCIVSSPSYQKLQMEVQYVQKNDRLWSTCMLLFSFSPYCSYYQTLFIDRSNRCGQRSKVAEVCINSTNKLKWYLGFFGNDWCSSPEEIVWMLLCSYKTWSDPKVMRVQKQSPCSDAKHAPRTLRERYAVWLMVSWNAR